MDYVISEGIPESELDSWLQQAAKKWGTFKDGRVNYTNADIAPIVMCTVVYKGKLLLVKRGYGLADAEGYWSTVNGFIDEPKSVAMQAQQEVNEELGLDIGLNAIRVAASYTLSNPNEKRKYIVFACRVDLDENPHITLDSENTDFKWIDREELSNFHILADLPEAIDAALNVR